MRLRRLTWGLLALLVAVAAYPAAAQTPQVGGGVTSIGIGNAYRAGTWTPVRVRVTNIPEPGNYTLAIAQRDLDGQRVGYTRDLALSAGDNDVELYFQPDPIRGLPETGREFVDQFRITLEGGGETIPLNVGQPPVEVAAVAGTRGRRDVRLIPVVGPRPVPAADYGSDLLRGTAEDVLLPRVRPGELPTSVLGYAAVDAVVWGDEPPEALTADQRRALEQFVRDGGHLVILQRPAEWQTMLRWGELLPVALTEPIRRNGPGPLARLAADPPAAYAEGDPQPLPSPWPQLAGPFVVGQPTPRPGAIVEATWEDAGPGEEGATPYIVRHVVGRGAVTYVGQDLTDPTLLREYRGRPLLGWSGVWAAVFGWADDPEFVAYPSPARGVEAARRATNDRWNADASRDLGTALLGDTSLPGRSTALVGIALAFFAGYWLLAGPGLFFWLRAKGRSSLSWFGFGAAAVAATLLTLGIVGLVLRGDPTAAYVALLRAGDEGRATAWANVGLYIPQDGPQTLDLKTTDGRNASDDSAVSYVGPLVGHPSHVDGDNLRSAPGAYVVPVRIEDSTDMGLVDVPFRSTLKRIEATWRGTLSQAAGVEGGVAGTAALYPPGNRRGKPTRFPVDLRGGLVNTTGRDLQRVYLAFRAQGPAGDWQDWLLYVPTWRDKAPLDLEVAIHGNGGNIPPAEPFPGGDPRPFGDERIFGRLDIRGDWPEALLGRLRGSFTTAGTQVSDGPLAVPALSFFDRFPPLRNEQGVRGGRPELLRRDARQWDTSPALVAGALVVVGEAGGPLPVPLRVNGDPPEADGRAVFQFVLPLDRSRVERAEGGGQRAEPEPAAAAR